MDQELRPPTSDQARGTVAATPETAAYTPTEPVSARFVVPFAIAYFGSWITLVTPVIVSLAVHLSRVLPQREWTAALSVIAAAGGVVGIVVPPVVGKLSDRTTARFGMRKPWVVAGTLVTLVGLVITGTARTVPLIVLGWCTVVAGLVTVLTMLTALLPDQVPHHQRGRVSGILTVGLAVGALGGSFLVQFLTAWPLLMFLAPAVVLVTGVGLLLFSYSDRRLDAAQARTMPRYGLREFFASFWVNPRRHPDFAWTWLNRFLLYLVGATLITYQAFYLINQLGYPVAKVAGLIAISTLVYYGCALVVSPVAGWLSDRLDRRKVFVVIAALGLAGGLGIIAAADDFTVFLAGMAISGAFTGAYLSVELALMTDILPNPDEAAKELGVFNIANSLSSVVAPAIAPALLAVPFLARGTQGNFVALFAAAALFAVLGAAAIQPVRRVR